LKKGQALIYKIVGSLLKKGPILKPETKSTVYLLQKDLH
jgi:hypothetical protein